MKSLDIYFPKKEEDDSKISFNDIYYATRGIIFAFNSEDKLEGIILYCSDDDTWLFCDVLDIDSCFASETNLQDLMKRANIDHLKLITFGE